MGVPTAIRNPACRMVIWRMLFGGRPTPLAPAVVPIGERAFFGQAGALDECGNDGLTVRALEFGVDRHRGLDLGLAVPDECFAIGDGALDRFLRNRRLLAGRFGADGV